MVQIKTRTKFRRPNWQQVVKHDRYLDDSVRDYRRQSIQAIDDLIMFGSKLPNITQSEIFSFGNVSRLVTQILHGNTEKLYKYEKNKNRSIYKGDNNDYDNEFSTRIVQIAAFIVRAATEVCIAYYKENHKHEPELNKYVVDPIMDAAMICQIIAGQKMVSMEPVAESIKFSDKLSNPVVTRFSRNQMYKRRN
jgi:hypothetical protein